jgi:hypothetical protein
LGPRLIFDRPGPKNFLWPFTRAALSVAMQQHLQHAHGHAMSTSTLRLSNFHAVVCTNEQRSFVENTASPD